jgi:hypothetical protein
MEVCWKTESEAERQVRSTMEGLESWKPWAPGVGLNSVVEHVSWFV